MKCIWFVTGLTRGMVNPNNEIELKDAIFPQVALLKK